jgi:AcrR family transcriptional regulator
MSYVRRQEVANQGNASALREDELPPRLARSIEVMWNPGGSSTRADRPRLNVSRIVELAIAVADSEGLDAVSMQRVAGELGYTAMALYGHIPGKPELVDLMREAAFGLPPESAASDGDWRTEIERWVHALWERYLQHPWALRVPTRSAPIGPNELAWFEAALRALSGTGLSAADMIAVTTFLSSAVRDMARIASELEPMGPGYGHVVARIIDGGRYPILTGLIRAGTFEDSNDDDVRPMLDLGLHHLLDGIEAHLAQAAAESSAAPKRKRKAADT